MQIPSRLERSLAGWRRELAWQSAPQALTWRLTGPDGEVRYLKTAPAGAEAPLRAEAARLRWARTSGLPVPAVLATFGQGRAEWLLTTGLAGLNATEAPLRADPQLLVHLLAAGLRLFHDLPVAACPYRLGPDAALARAGRRVRAGLVLPEDMHPEHASLGPEQALAELRRLRPDRQPDLVVCRGDYCLPNVLLAGGQLSGFVDLGELAVADRWYDLAVATWSVTWNLGPGWEDLFLAGYGIARDDRALAFYRLLYDLR